MPLTPSHSNQTPCSQLNGISQNAASLNFIFFADTYSRSDEMWKKYFLNVANSAGERSGIRCKGNTIAFNVKPFVFVVIRFRSRRLRFRFSKCDLNVVMSFKIECIFVAIQFHKKYALFSKNSFDFENIHVRFENFHIIFVNMFKIKYLKELFYIC